MIRISVSFWFSPPLLSYLAHSIPTITDCLTVSETRVGPLSCSLCLTIVTPGKAVANSFISFKSLLRLHCLDKAHPYLIWQTGPSPSLNTHSWPALFCSNISFLFLLSSHSTHHPRTLDHLLIYCVFSASSCQHISFERLMSDDCFVHW